MNTEWLYKCQEGAGELSPGKDTKFYSPEMFPSLIPKEIVNILLKEHSATLPVFIQPGGFSASQHVGNNSTEELNDWFLDQPVSDQSFNKSVTILLSCSLVNSEALRSIDEDRVYGTN